MIQHSLSRASFASAFTLILVILVATSGSTVYSQSQQVVTGSQRVDLQTGDSLIVHSDQMSLQRVILEGNITKATLSKPSEYPAHNFGITVETQGSITLRAFFDYAHDYEVTVATQPSNSDLEHANSTYYISQGSFELDIAISVSKRNAPIEVPPLSPS